MLRSVSDNFSKQGDGFSGHPSVAFKDSVQDCKGILQIKIWKGPVGSVLDKVIEDNNLVVTMARKLMSRLISGAANGATITKNNNPIAITNPANLFITRMKWGTGGHDILIPTNPLTPSVNDEDLAVSIVSPASKLCAIDYPTTTSIRFTASLEQNEANGNGLSEEGLFSDDLQFLFARKTFGLLSKTSDFSFTFAHTILM